MRPSRVAVTELLRIAIDAMARSTVPVQRHDGARTWPFDLASRSKYTPAARQTTTATIDASGPKAPPVSSDDPRTWPSRKPELCTPDVGNPKMPPCVKFHAMWIPMASQILLVTM
jgi:hypothetical protein